MQVFFMHCGFAMLSVGCVRAKFAKHIAMLILVDACTSGIAWYFFGCVAWPPALCRKAGYSYKPFAKTCVV